MKLTDARGAEKLALLLTGANRKFKIIIDDKVESDFLFSSINSVKHSGKHLTEWQKNELKRLFCDFLAESLEMTISEVDAKYGRPTDHGDVAVENDESFQPVHYGLCEKVAENTEKPPYGHFARLHGCYNNDGYFVVMRFDWCHSYHNTPKK